MQKDSAQAKISLKVVGGLLFLTHPVYATRLRHLLHGSLQLPLYWWTGSRGRAAVGVGVNLPHKLDQV